MKTLIEAVQDAIARAGEALDADEIECTNHLMAQKYEYPDGACFWEVAISDEFDRDDLTHLSSSIFDLEGAAEDVAGRIEAMWDDGWTEVPSDPTHPQSKPWVQNDQRGAE